MKAQWQALADRYAALQQREKVMVAVAVVVGIGFIGHTVWVDPPARRLKAVEGQVHQQKTDQESLRIQLANLRTQVRDPDGPNRAALSDARARLTQTDQELARFSGTLVAPERIPQLLQSLLSRHGGLSLVSLRTLPPTPLIAPPVPAKEAKAGETPPSLPPGSNIFRHGIEIKVAGNYQSLLGYVGELERAPQKLLWEGMSLKVISYPRSELTLTIYTLSLDPTWLIV